MLEDIISLESDLEVLDETGPYVFDQDEIDQEFSEGAFVVHPEIPKLNKILTRCNLSRRVFGAASAKKPALSRPSLCPDFGERKYKQLVCGTEDSDTHHKANCQLIFFQLEGYKLRETKNGRDVVWTLDTGLTEDHIRDIHWIDTRHIIFAQGKYLGLVRQGIDYNVDQLIILPDFHTDIIREIATCPRDKRLILSGGFDGKVFVTDLVTLVEDVQKNESKSTNSLYNCAEVVGSVAWHPLDPFLGSCTTDLGTLHLFDIRTNKGRSAIIVDTKKVELYTHSYINEKEVVLGYGDGVLLHYDVRNMQMVKKMEDPFQEIIGEIRFDYGNKLFVVFGAPEFTMWMYGPQGQPCAHFNLLAEDDKDESEFVDITSTAATFFTSEFYKTSGCFMGNKVLAVTDSLGTFALFDYSSVMRK